MAFIEFFLSRATYIQQATLIVKKQDYVSMYRCCHVDFLEHFCIAQKFPCVIKIL